MSLTVFVAVLAAALLHAGWNALVRVGTAKVTLMLILTLVQAAIGLAMALARPWPESDIWLWLLASGVLHCGYKAFLAFAYEHGDLSRVYPIARGTAPLIVLTISLLLFDEVIGGTGLFAVLALGIGIVAMGLGAFTSGESRKLVPLALASATMTAGYSLVDGYGARAAADAVTFVAWVFVFDAVFFLPLVLALRGFSVVRASANAWGLGSVAALLSFLSYTVVVWAMTVAPIALITALRETSILFAVLIGWLAFGEKMDRTKVVAAVLILSGVVLTRL